MATVLVTLATFLLVTGFVVALYLATLAESTAAQRLRRLVPDLGRPLGERRAPLRVAEFVIRVLTALGEHGVGGGERATGRLLAEAGIRGTNAALLFVGVRTLLSVGPALLVLVPRISAGRPIGQSLGLTALTWLCGHLLVNYWLRRRRRNRIQLLTETLPDALDLMVVSLEAGLGLNATIARVGEERAAMNDPLGREFGQVTLELRGGRSREEALRALGERNGVDDLKALAGLVIQSDRLGASMAKTLRVHADILRTKRRQRAEETARKLPIKVLFPLAAFILPALFTVALGPALLRISSLAGIFGH